MITEQIEELEEFLKDKPHYNIIYVDYANPKNVIVSHNIEEFSRLDLKHFIKLYIFNHDFMRTYTRKGPKQFIMEEIHKDDFEQGYVEKTFFIHYSEYKKLHLRIGKIGNKNTLQYLRFEK